MALASSAALRLAGLGPGTPDPPDGSIDRGAGGAPTGILREGAVRLAAAAAPPPPAAQRRVAARAAAAYALSRGVTAVVDMGRRAGRVRRGAAGRQGPSGGARPGGGAQAECACGAAGGKGALRRLRAAQNPAAISLHPSAWGRYV
jgi:hypothetical protein